MPGPYLFEGIDLGHLFARIYHHTRHSFLNYNCALFVVEPDPALLALALCVHDWTDLLADPSVFIFTGPNAVTALLDTFERDPDLPWPAHCFRSAETQNHPTIDARQAVATAHEHRAETLEQLSRRVSARYADKTPAHWARRFRQALSGAGPRLSVVAVVSRQTTFLQYSMRDIQHALESLGHRCTLLIEKQDHQKISPITILRAIEDADADLFFVLDHLRPEFNLALPPNLPVLTWDQDCLPHVMTRHNLAGIAPHDFLVGCSKARFISLGHDPDQYVATLIPTNPDRFAGPPLSDSERDRYTCDVSYVSHASQTPQAFHAEERAKHNDPNITCFLDALYQQMPDALDRWGVAGGALATELIDNTCRRLGARIENDELTAWLTDWYV